MTRRPRPLRRWGLSLFALLLFASPALAEPTEAERQLEFARQELAAGRAERAIASCESALRFDSGLDEAFVVKALALEVLGELPRARALLVGYRELRGEQPLSAEAVEAMGRLGVLPGAASTPAVAAPPLPPGPRGRAPRIDRGNWESVSDTLSREFEGYGFIARWTYRCADAKDEHELSLRSKGLRFRMDRGGTLKIEGEQEAALTLKKDAWRCGDGATNELELRFDGDRLRADVNGAVLGPIWVRKDAAGTARDTITVRVRGDGGSVIEDFELTPWGGPETTELALGRIEQDGVKGAAARIGKEWESGRFVLDYTVAATGKGSAHAMRWSELGVGFIVDARGLLKLRSDESTVRDLSGRWLQNADNAVQLRFDGDNLTIAVNGAEVFGPTRVRDGSPKDARPLTWELMLDDATFTEFTLRPWTP